MLCRYKFSLSVWILPQSSISPLGWTLTVLQSNCEIVNVDYSNERQRESNFPLKLSLRPSRGF